jgi:hypothetical protein
MAKPIKDTPTLVGKDAELFIKAMNSSKDSKISDEVRERMIKNFQAVQSLIKK